MNIVRAAFSLAAVALFSALAAAQKVVNLYPGAAPGSESWSQHRREYYSPAWKTEIVANVVRPTLTAYLPEPAIATGTSVVICPGGAFYGLSINSEGRDVAKWLAARGVGAFVLEYRLVRTGADAGAEATAAMNTPSAFQAATNSLVLMATADAGAAVAYVRAHAAEYSVSRERVGLMGFSAGGTLAAAVALHHTAESRPDFVAAIYAYTWSLLPAPVPSDAPPIWIAAATDDGLGVAPGSVDLYSRWTAANRPAELHMYSRGGHGFGMRTQHLPSDNWIGLFYAWLGVQGLLKR